jgi:hypothetical protein
MIVVKVTVGTINLTNNMGLFMATIQRRRYHPQERHCLLADLDHP